MKGIGKRKLHDTRKKKKKKRIGSDLRTQSMSFADLCESGSG